MPRKCVLAWLLLIGSVTPAEPPRVLVPCRVLSVHDGDTLTVDVLFPWDVTLREQTVRCQGYDAWEVTRARRTVQITEDELRKGAAARTALQGLLEAAEGVYLQPTDERDPYGRLPAYLVVWDEGELVDAADWMRSRGHVRSGD